MTSFLRWQFAQAPAWLFQLFWNLQRFLWRYFSVSFMLRTLLAHWRKDAVAYRPGAFMLAFAWNQISRLIGFVVRSSVVVSWLAVESVFILFAAPILALFLLWPLLTIIGFSLGITLLTT